MKKSKQILAILLSVILLSATLTATPVYAQEQNNEVKMERTVQKSLSAAEKRTQRIAAGPMVSVSNYTELSEAIEAKATNIYLLQNIQLENALQIDYDVFFLADSVGKTLYAAPGHRHIQTTASDVQLQFDNVILDGKYESGTDTCGGIDAPFKNISLVGVVIQNCYSKCGSAILNEPEAEFGAFSIYNSVIRNNKVGVDSAVFIVADDITIYHTTVENNEGLNKSSAGSGLNLGPRDESTQASAVIYDSVIRDNSSNIGGGIYLWYTDVVINNNTIIENNSALNQGGAIYSEHSNIESYAQIKNNVADNCGGGIYLCNSTFTMQDGAVSFNTAGMNSTSFNHYGGGIAISADDAQNDIMINNGILEGNTAPFGGGIGCSYAYPLTKSTVQINGGTIRKNGFCISEDETVTNVSINGGGILAASVKMTGGTIEQNLCTGSGAGIYTDTLDMSGGLIQDNGYYESADGEIFVKTVSGGGVYIGKGSATITDGLIYSNQANRGAGLYIMGTLNLSAPAYIRYNHAADLYGGVYCSNTNTDHVDLTRIRNNSAENGNPQYNFR